MRENGFQLHSLSLTGTPLLRKKHDLVNILTSQDGVRQHSISWGLQVFNTDLLAVPVQSDKAAGELVAFTGGDLRPPNKQKFIVKTNP